jgi:hypothetical protein
MVAIVTVVMLNILIVEQIAIDHIKRQKEYNLEEEGVTIEENNLNQGLGSIKTTRLINISNIVKDNVPTYIVTNNSQIITI